MLPQCPADGEQRESEGGDGHEAYFDRKERAIMGVLEQERNAEEQDDDTDFHDDVAGGEKRPDRRADPVRECDPGCLSYGALRDGFRRRIALCRVALRRVVAAGRRLWSGSGSRHGCGWGRRSDGKLRGLRRHEFEPTLECLQACAQAQVPSGQRTHGAAEQEAGHALGEGANRAEQHSENESHRQRVSRITRSDDRTAPANVSRLIPDVAAATTGGIAPWHPYRLPGCG